jgi:hypothetical protein
MADVKIYENPGNKAARLERENAQLRAENRRLREALGEGHVMIAAVATGGPAIDQAVNSFTMPGGATVTIGRKPGGGRPSAIPSLQQQAVPENAGATSIQIYDANAAAADLEAQMAQAQPAMTRPTVAAPQRAPQRMINGKPAAGGGGGMVEIPLGQLRPTPIPAQPPQPRLPAPPAQQPSAVDEAKERFALLELDLEPDQQQTGTK